MSCGKQPEKVLGFLKSKGILKTPYLYLGAFLVSLAVISFHSVQIHNNDLSANVSAQFNYRSPFLSQKEIIQLEPPELVLIQNNSLKAVSPPINFKPKVLGTLVGVEEGEENKTITEYTVKAGDTLSALAEKFGISVDTIRWANDLSKSSLIKTGQTLVILPVSGVMHLVKEGDTITQIAKEYKGDTEKIIDFNELSEEGEIFVGDILIIPDGQMPKPKVVATAPAGIPLAKSYFIVPISLPALVTQGYHYYHAIDFSHKGGSCGDPVSAAAGGIVQKTAYRYPHGKYVQILHPNGVVTLYAHLQDIMVEPGQKVTQGEIIGLVGYTGRTIPAGPQGCHVHFEVRGATNPFYIYSRGTVLTK